MLVHRDDLFSLVLRTGKPRVVVAYNKTAGQFLMGGFPTTSSMQEREFHTSRASGRGRQRQVARWIEPADDRFGLIILSQAPTAPASIDADGIAMRVWAATLVRSWISSDLVVDACAINIPCRRGRGARSELLLNSNGLHDRDRW